VYITQQDAPHKAKILHLALYGREIWSLAFREKHELRMFENRMLRRIFAPRGDEVTGGWRKLHNEVHHDMCPSPSIITITV
jgi:hypothetical protein